jgi:tetratricopeptide (TPR) repeat protein
MLGSAKTWASHLWRMSLQRKLILLLALLVAGGSACFWVLSTPANPLTSFFRLEMSDMGERVVIGPYPTEKDFEVLEQNHVETIVTLLDPTLPYERPPLGREIELARKYNMRVLNFPMESVLGQSLGEYDSQNAAAAADAIARTPGKVYLHCYLGVHRTAAVRDLLRAKGIGVGRDFNERKLSEDGMLWEDAQGDYGLGRFQEALEKLMKIKKQDYAVRDLEAWSTYKLGDAATAQRLFQALVGEKDNLDARVGLGYSALRQNDLRTADEQFAEALKMSPDAEPSQAGMGMVRYREGKSAEACAYLETALQRDLGHDQDARDLFNRLDCASRRGSAPKH